jgi:hypothetical protein
MTNTDFGQFTLGRVVKQKNPLPLMGRYTDTYKSYFKGMYGHITGFDVAEYDEGFDTILLIKWCDGKEYAVHPSAVELL